MCKRNVMCHFVYLHRFIVTLYISSHTKWTHLSCFFCVKFPRMQFVKKLRFLSNIFRAHTVLLAARIAEVILVVIGRCRYWVSRITAVLDASSKLVDFRGPNCSSPESAFFLPLWESHVNPQSVSCTESSLVQILKIKAVVLA